MAVFRSDQAQITFAADAAHETETTRVQYYRVMTQP